MPTQSSIQLYGQFLMPRKWKVVLSPSRGSVCEFTDEQLTQYHLNRIIQGTLDQGDSFMKYRLSYINWVGTNTAYSY